MRFELGPKTAGCWRRPGGNTDRGGRADAIARSNEGRLPRVSRPGSMNHAKPRAPASGRQLETSSPRTRRGSNGRGDATRIVRSDRTDVYTSANARDEMRMAITRRRAPSPRVAALSTAYRWHRRVEGRTKRRSVARADRTQDAQDRGTDAACTRVDPEAADNVDKAAAC